MLLEVELFARICDELKEIFRKKYKNFFQIMKYTLIKEDEMLENNLMQIILNDIISTEEYTLEGIATYTDIHIDIIRELASGLNTKPLATCLRKVIELHRTVRRDLYQTISKKIVAGSVATLSTDCGCIPLIRCSVHDVSQNKKVGSFSYKS